MIWALLFALLFSSVGDSPLLLPESEKIIKKHVDEEDRKNELLLLIKDAQTERKLYAKEDKRVLKELNKLSQSRASKEKEFDLLIKDSESISAKSQKASFNLINESQNLITESEWKKMQADYKKGLAKLDKDLAKNAKLLKKHFSKLNIRIEKSVSDKGKAEIVIKSLKNLESETQTLNDEYRKEMKNENSIVFQYKVEKQQIKNIQQKHNSNIAKLLNDYKKLHFLIVENTTDKEFKKISSKLKLPF